MSCSISGTLKNLCIVISNQHLSEFQITYISRVIMSVMSKYHIYGYSDEWKSSIFQWYVLISNLILIFDSAIQYVPMELVSCSHMNMQMNWNIYISKIQRNHQYYFHNTELRFHQRHRRPGRMHGFKITRGESSNRESLRAGTQHKTKPYYNI